MIVLGGVVASCLVTATAVFASPPEERTRAESETVRTIVAVSGPSASVGAERFDFDGAETTQAVLVALDASVRELVALSRLQLAASQLAIELQSLARLSESKSSVSSRLHQTARMVELLDAQMSEAGENFGDRRRIEVIEGHLSLRQQEVDDLRDEVARLDHLWMVSLDTIEDLRLQLDEASVQRPGIAQQGLGDRAEVPPVAAEGSPR